MAAPAKTEISWQWPADVLAYAAEHQVQPYLEPLLQILRRIFPTARWIKAYLQDDPEFRDDWHIVFDVQVEGLNLAQARTAREQWNHELFRVCPAPLVCTFRLCLDLVSS